MSLDRAPSCGATQAEQQSTIGKLKQENDALKFENAMLRQTIAKQEKLLVEYSWITNPDRMGQ